MADILDLALGNNSSPLMDFAQGFMGGFRQEPQAPNISGLPAIPSMIIANAVQKSNNSLGNRVADSFFGGISTGLEGIKKKQAKEKMQELIDKGKAKISVENGEIKVVAVDESAEWQNRLKQIQAETAQTNAETSRLKFETEKGKPDYKEINYALEKLKSVSINIRNQVDAENLKIKGASDSLKTLTTESEFSDPERQKEILDKKKKLEEQISNSYGNIEKFQKQLSENSKDVKAVEVIKKQVGEDIYREEEKKKEESDNFSQAVILMVKNGWSKADAIKYLREQGGE
jgi:rhodanese-related sulfurtransferase